MQPSLVPRSFSRTCTTPTKSQKASVANWAHGGSGIRSRHEQVGFSQSKPEATGLCLTHPETDPPRQPELPATPGCTATRSQAPVRPEHQLPDRSPFGGSFRYDSPRKRPTKQRTPGAREKADPKSQLLTRYHPIPGHSAELHFPSDAAEGDGRTGAQPRDATRGKAQAQRWRVPPKTCKIAGRHLGTSQKPIRQALRLRMN